MEPVQAQLLRIPAVAKILGCQTEIEARRLIERLRARGELRTVKLGRSLRIPVGEIERLVREGTAPAPGGAR